MASPFGGMVALAADWVVPLSWMIDLLRADPKI